MRNREKIFISSYFNTQITQLEETVGELQTRCRFRKVDLSDTYELQYALVRLELMKQVCSDVTVFLNFDKNFVEVGKTTKKR